MATGLTFNVFGHDVSASSTLRRVAGEADATSTRIGSHFKRLAGVISGAFAGAGVVSFFKGAFDEATEAQKVGAQTTAVLKSTGGAANVTAGQIGNLSTAISNKVGIDDEAIQSGENLLLTFTGIRNEVGKGNDIFNQSTQIMTDMSVALGQDMKSSAIQLGKALNNPIKGITALQRVGVSFTDQQRSQIKAMVASGNTLGAQKVILAELTKEFGGSAAAQATSGEKMQVAFKNLEEQVGTALLPVFTALANFITQRVIPAVGMAVAWITKHKQGFIELGQAIQGFLIGAYNNLIKPLLNFLIPIIKSIIGWIEKHKEGLAQLAKVIAVVVVVAIKVLITVVQTWLRIMIAVITAIGNAAMWLWRNAIHPAFTGISAVFRAVATVAQWLWSNILRPIFDAIGAAWRALAVSVKAVAGWIAAAFRAAAGALSWAWGNIIKPVISAISGAWHWLYDHVIGPVARAIGAAFKAIGAALQWAWDHSIGPIIHAITSGINGITNAVNTAISAFDILTGKTGHIVGGTPNAGSFNTTGSSGGSPIKAGHNAQGTGFFKGGLSWVGEHGQELVRMPRGAQVYSHSQAMSMVRNAAGGGDTHVTVELNVAGSVLSQRDLIGELEKAVRQVGSIHIARQIKP